MTIVEERWPEIIEHLRNEHDLSNVSFTTWIQPLKICNVVGNNVFILANKNVSIEYIHKKYYLPLKVCIEEITDIPYDITFVSEEDNLEDLFGSKEKDAGRKKMKSNAEKAGLKPKYTFDTFVVGSNNRFAHAASVAVSESPGKVYNPLFLYGGVGLGKTHLMHSIAHFILENDPEKKVLYVTSETFTNDLIEALRHGRSTSKEDFEISNFREKYRNIDVLLIDDIQFIIGKESTQEEFFHTFNHLHNLGKQIIITSDKPPKDIETLEARLRTRFEWGLIADISSPDYETRMAILHKNIEMEHLEKYNISDEVIDFIATHIKSNIRELEGSLNRLVALYKLNHYEKPIDIALAAESIKDFVTEDNERAVTPEYIMEIVADHFNLTVADLKSNRRNAEVTYPRQLCMYLIRTMTDTSLKSVGAFLGGKDHSTVKHGYDKIDEDRKNDDSVANTLHILTKKINPL